MDDETLAPQEAPDDDLLNWVPPELEQRAILTAEKDAGIYRSKKIQRKRKEKRLDFGKPPAGRNSKLALAFLLGAALFLALGTILAATGANGQQAMQDKTQLGFALWMSGKAAVLCVLLLFFLPLDKAIRRPVMLTMILASLIFNAAGELPGAMQTAAAGATGEVPTEALVAIAVVGTLLGLVFFPDAWLLLGLARRRSSEKLAAVLGCVPVLVCLLTVITDLIKPEAAKRPVYLTAMEGLQLGCYVALLFSWPVLDRPVSTNPPAINISEGEETDGQPE